MAQVSLIELGQVGDYEIRLLKVFKTVVECGGFSAAETVLNISRSTISVHMANLEQRLKLKLCSRGRAGFALTDEGAIIYESVRRLFSQLEDFRSTVNALHVQISGELKLVASDTISLDERCCFPEVLAEFCQQAPDVFVQFETAPMSDIERMILTARWMWALSPITASWTALSTIRSMRRPVISTAARCTRYLANRMKRSCANGCRTVARCRPVSRPTPRWRCRWWD